MPGLSAYCTQKHSVIELLKFSLTDEELVYRRGEKLIAVEAVPLLTVLGPKSYLRSFAQVLSQYYEVDQRLRMTAIL